MNKLKPFFFSVLLLSTLFLLFSITTFAMEDVVVENPSDEIPTEEVANESQSEDVAEEEITTENTIEEVVVEQPLTATVTVNIGNEYIFTVNEDGTVASIEATTEEASSVLDTLVLDELTLQESINTLLTTVENEEIETSIYILTQDETLLTSLDETLRTEFGEVVESVLEEDEEIVEESPELIEERFKLAEELGITPGKMNLLQKLATSSESEIDYSEWATKPVKDIMKTIKENRTAQQAVEDVEEELINNETEAINTQSIDTAQSTKSKPDKSDKSKSSHSGSSKSKGKK